MRPFIDGWFYLPYNQIKNIDSLKQELTVISSYKKEGEPPKIICMYDDKSYRYDYFGVPLRFGLDRIKKIMPRDWASFAINRSSLGKPFTENNFTKTPDLEHKNASPIQKVIAPQLLELLVKKQATILKAETGTGKTSLALWLATQLRVSTLIVVHKERLKEQWIQEIQDKLGIQKEEVGIIQGPICNIKPITIAMLQTLCKGRHRDTLRDQFGFFVVDETHNLGAEKFSQVMGQVNAYYNLALSATTQRRDGCHKAYELHFGPVETTAKAAALPVQVKHLTYHSPNKNWGKDRNGKIKCLSADYKRNDKLADLIMKLVKDNRKILIIGDYRAHLETIFTYCLKRGLDPDTCGHFYGEGIKVIPQASGAPTHKDKPYFEWLIENANIIFATYGMMKEGISINRLDAGIDISPRSEAKQVLGRIRRPFPNKRLPIWYTINDTNDYKIHSYFKARMEEYEADESVEVINGGLL